MTTVQAPLAAADEAIRHSRVLVVDDEPTNCLVVQRYLKLDGLANITLITDSREVVPHVTDNVPDIILLDLMMPHVSGLEVLDALRREVLPGVFLPILVLTARADLETKRKALELGATDFLTKPLDPNDLLPRVRNLLWMRRQAREMQDYARRLELDVRQRTQELMESRMAVV
ncbi:MAG: response regulator, partial [Rhodocyclaceae bacterium]|nr:response regulator [Rhodocyclaceae bacterium]